MFSSEDIEKLKKLLNLNSNKGRGHDNIGIRMRKMCGDSFCIPLGSIAKQAPLSASFSSELEKNCYSLSQTMR